LNLLIGFTRHILIQFETNESNFFGSNDPLKTQFTLMLEGIIEGFRGCVSVLSKAKPKTDFEEPRQGHLVLMNCGHRGKPSRMEEKRISRLLRKSGFIPMLEELYGLPPPTEKGGTKEDANNEAKKRRLH
jgi:hypothetical protein